MHPIKLAFASLALVSSSSFAQDCTAPDVPTTPDGATSTMEQMLGGQQAVKTFQTANLEYMGCLDPQIKAATEAATADGATEDDKNALRELEAKYNSAVSQEEGVAGEFNTQIRAYKAANPS